MTFIATVPYASAEGRLKQLYDRIRGPDGAIDNIMAAHSLRPHTMDGHMALYKNVLHHNGNTLPKALLETVGVHVSLLNDCAYCVEHHFAGLIRLLGDAARANAIRSALESGAFAGVLDTREVAALRYAEALTRSPSTITQTHIAELHTAGFDDGEILELNQVTAYFAYANRTVLGLGVTLAGDVLGLSPGNSESPDDWGHR